MRDHRASSERGPKASATILHSSTGKSGQREALGFEYWSYAVDGGRDRSSGAEAMAELSGRSRLVAKVEAGAFRS